MYAIKINWDKYVDWHKKHGLMKNMVNQQFVDKSLLNYTTEKEARKFRTEEKAERHITESWEEVVKL